MFQTVLSSNKLIEKSREYDFLHPWLSTGLLTSSGKQTIFLLSYIKVYNFRSLCQVPLDCISFRLLQSITEPTCTIELNTNIFHAGNKWFTRRKMLTPTFHFKILEDFVQVFNEQTDILITRLTRAAEEMDDFNIYPFITRCTLDIICGIFSCNKHTCMLHSQ